MFFFSVTGKSLIQFYIQESPTFRVSFFFKSVKKFSRFEGLLGYTGENFYDNILLYEFER